MEKSYETYAKKALMLKHTHKQEAGKIRDTIGQIDSNQRLSDFGKREAIEKLKGEAGNLNKQFSDSIRGQSGSSAKNLALLLQRITQTTLPTLQTPLKSLRCAEAS